MAKKFSIVANVREKRSPAAIRRGGQIPAILYGHGIKSQSIQVDAKLFAKLFQQAGSTTLINLAVVGKDHNVLVRDVQYHPLKNTIIHVDFYQVRLDEVIRARVPLNFIGESVAVKDLGGVLVRSMDEVELEALPADLPHDIEVDISTLTDFEKVIHISDLTVPTGVTLLHEPDEVVALVQAPRSEEELAALEEEVKEEVEAVEGVKEEEKPAEGKEGAAPEGEVGKQTVPPEGKPE